MVSIIGSLSTTHAEKHIIAHASKSEIYWAKEKIMQFIKSLKPAACIAIDLRNFSGDKTW